MAGSGYESTRITIAFSKKVAEAGADCVSILTPSYFKKRLTDDAMVRYYMDIDDAVPIPIILYNAPGFTGMTISPAVIEKISRHQNIAGMKDTSKGNISSYLSVCSDSFIILSGTASTLFTAMVLGAKGGVVSLANAFPDPCCQLYDKYIAGDIEGVRRLHYLLFQLNKSVSGSYGVAGVKYAMEIAGFNGGDPRLPLLPITNEGKKAIKNAISNSGII